MTDGHVQYWADVSAYECLRDILFPFTPPSFFELFGEEPVHISDICFYCREPFKETDEWEFSLEWDAFFHAECPKHPKPTHRLKVPEWIT